MSLSWLTDWRHTHRSENLYLFSIFEKKQRIENCHSQAQHCNQSSRTRNEKKYILRKKYTCIIIFCLHFKLKWKSKKAGDLKGHMIQIPKQTGWQRNFQNNYINLLWKIQKIYLQCTCIVNVFSLCLQHVYYTYNVFQYCIGL